MERVVVKSRLQGGGLIKAAYALFVVVLLAVT
jgi:hypothetical protein